MPRFIKTHKQLPRLGMSGIAGFIYSRRVILMPYRTSDAGIGASGCICHSKGLSAPSARTLWITTSAWNVNVEWVSATASVPEHCWTLTIPRHSCDSNVYIMMNEYTMMNVLYTCGVICIVYFLLNVPQTPVHWHHAVQVSSAKVFYQGYKFLYIYFTWQFGKFRHWDTAFILTYSEMNIVFLIKAYWGLRAGFVFHTHYPPVKAQIVVFVLWFLLVLLIS